MFKFKLGLADGFIKLETSMGRLGARRREVSTIHLMPNTLARRPRGFAMEEWLPTKVKILGSNLRWVGT